MNTASEFFPMQDPIVNSELAGDPKELEAIAAYKKGKRELKKKLELGGGGLELEQRVGAAGVAGEQPAHRDLRNSSGGAAFDAWALRNSMGAIRCAGFE